jgi:hypothetical protein
MKLDRFTQAKEAESRRDYAVKNAESVRDNSCLGAKATLEKDILGQFDSGRLRYGVAGVTNRVAEMRDAMIAWGNATNKAEADCACAVKVAEAEFAATLAKL